MSGEYVNRKDQRYFLYQGQTKTGKPKYFCSRKESASGVRLEEMPEGYEWREGPADGAMSVRKIRPTQILPLEKELLSKAIRDQAGLQTFIVDLTEDSLAAYIPDRDPAQVNRFFQLLGAPTGMGDWTAMNSRYSPLMKFTLQDEEKRLFAAYRWCFKGRIDDWIQLSGSAPLSKLIDRYVRHLGKESFYELM